MQINLFWVLFVLGLVLIGTIVSLLYYIFFQKPEVKREMKANRKRIVEYLQNTSITHSSVDKIAKSLGIEEYTARDILLDLAREGNLRGILVFPDHYYDFRYCHDVIDSLQKRQSSDQIPLDLLAKEFDTTKHNAQKILIELTTNNWIHGHLDSVKETFDLYKDELKAKELKCPYCNAALPSVATTPNCPECGAEFKKCGVCNLILGQGEFSSCPYCGAPSHTDHLLEWLKIKGKCPVCKHKLKPHQIP